MAYENKLAPHARTHDPLAALEADATQLAEYPYRRGLSAGNAQQYAAARRYLARQGVDTTALRARWLGTASTPHDSSPPPPVDPVLALVYGVVETQVQAAQAAVQPPRGAARYLRRLRCG